jgi:two-component system nitrate/nitrite response regulator NarL
MRREPRRGIIGDMAIRCLIVDDSLRFLRSASAMLESQGAMVAVASTGDAAVLGLADAPDVILVDLQLGAERGFDVIRSLREAGARNTAIIAISSHDPSDVMDLVAASEADGFIAKSRLSLGALTALMERDPGPDGRDGGFDPR